MLLISSRERDDELVMKAKEFAQKKLAPYGEKWEKEHVQGDVFREMIRTFSPMVIPEELGGFGKSKRTVSRVLEELAKGDVGMTFSMAVHNIFCIAVSTMKNTEFRDRYLKKAMTGELIGAILITEKNAGSDMGGMNVSTVREGDSWVINAEKVWITNAASADLFMTFLRCGEGSKAMPGFLLEKGTPGLSCTEQYDMIGAHASVCGTIKLENVRVSDDRMAFAPEIGMHAALGAIDIARLGIASMANGVCSDALEKACNYCKNRKQFKKPLTANQAISHKLVNAITDLEASRLLTLTAADELDNGENGSIAVAHAKKYAVEHSFKGTAAAMHAMGANGLKRENGIVKQFTGMNIFFDTDGTNEICNLVLSRSVL